MAQNITTTTTTTVVMGVGMAERDDLSWIEAHSSAFVAFCIIYFGYIFTSLFLNAYFYYYRGKTKKNNNSSSSSSGGDLVPDLLLNWKIQPQLGTGRIGHCVWGIPLLSRKPDRAWGHWALTSFNLLMASCFGAVVADLCSRGLFNKMNFDDYREYGLKRIFIELVIAVTHESVVEYYWHRLMHTRMFYATFHKLHHSYKSPEPFDDMYIHPLEAFGYYCILYSPPFLYSCHIYSFVSYMIIMGICGIMDHSGVHCCIPNIYNTADHDAHHAKFEVNYGFPFIFMDLLHGTFEGTLLGRQFSCNNHKKE